MAQLIRHRDDNPSDLLWISQHWQQPIQRTFWMYNVPSSSWRGGHRHQADCQMVLYCPIGHVRVYVQTPTQDHVYSLHANHEYLFLAGSDWRLMDGFSPDAVLTVLSSHCYETTLYIDQPYRPVAPSINESRPYLSLVNRRGMKLIGQASLTGPAAENQLIRNNHFQPSLFHMEKQIHSKRALVLGGGAQVGRAWLAGLASKLIEEGVQLPTADLILGTSAGALVGAEIALRTLDLNNPPPTPAGYVAPQSSATGALAQLAPLMAQVVSSSMPEIALQILGQVALEIPTMSQEQAMQRVGHLVGQSWPHNFKATAVNVSSGERVLWEQDSAIPLAIGLASSGALPSAFPPVTIGAQRYMDGATRSMLNADLAAGYDEVIVVSCFSLELSGLDLHTDQHILSVGLQSEIDLLRRRGATVQVISPNADFLQLTQEGTQMLNLSLMPQAWRIGRSQAIDEKEAIDRAWYLA